MSFSEEPGDGAVCYENSLSFTDDADTVARHARQFELLTSQVLDPAATRSYLQAALADHEGPGFPERMITHVGTTLDQGACDWRKSSYSGGQAGNCIEQGLRPDGLIPVRGAHVSCPGTA
ncbi:DUF397 domain-containing protein [Streptomyces tateyamensis]|uniref:DUF397 domain-containing protein n=1 Tax=Streptomyces tateyamensis TaxID=565073 RepID=UPI0011B3FCFE|nr:DUF397 domain-containing protein [Streptomyces tateyamensis]